MRNGEEIADEQLMQLILAAEEESIAAGNHSPKARSFDVPLQVMKKLGYLSYGISGSGAPSVFSRIQAVQSSLYRKSDLAIGGLHGGFFMFHGVFCRFHVPIVFGTAEIQPLELTDLTPIQLNWLCSKPKDLERYFDQFVDVFDFAGGTYGLGEYQQPPKDALELFQLAGFQLQAAAATLCAAYDFRGAIQSSILGAELALKGGLIATGVTMYDIKNVFGHNKEKVAQSFAKLQKNFDLSCVLSRLAILPPYVENRYSPDQPDRMETAEIAMAAQYIAGEVMRSVCGYSLKTALRQGRSKS